MTNDKVNKKFNADDADVFVLRLIKWTKNFGGYND